MLAATGFFLASSATELIRAPDLTVAVKDVGGGKLIATVRDADGNITGLAQSP